MKRRGGFALLLKSVVVLGSLGVIITGVTFAALQSANTTLANNTINVGTADLRISTDGVSFPTTINTGLTFNNVVPGGAAVPTDGYTIYLKNIGSVNLAIKAGIGPVAPTNLGGVDLTKTYLHVTRADGTYDQSFSIKSLIDGYAAGVGIGDTINTGITAQYKLRVSMDSGAYSGSGSLVSISGINLVFSGSGL
jgi:hypothetical protein